MTGPEWNRANPAFRVPASTDVVFEPDAGMLAAARGGLQVELAQAMGGEHTEVMLSTPVRRLDLDGTRAVVVTDTLEIVADRLIVTAGAWVKQLLPLLPVPLQVTRQRVVYFRPTEAAPFRIGRFPVFIFMGEDPGYAFYGMPGLEGLGVKVARHYGPEANPDEVDRTVPDDYRGIVLGFLRDHIPALAAAPIDLTETCLYTVAPDDHFVVDFVTGRTDVIVASPCSGHGFKFSCLIGKVLAELATLGASENRIPEWSLPEPHIPLPDRRPFC